MKLLAVTGIFPPDIGGPASYVPRIARALVERGHGVEVLTLAEQVEPSAHESYAFPVHRLDRNKQRLLRVGETIARIAALARDADVVFANGLVFESLIAAGLARRPVVVKVVGDTVWERARNAGRAETIDAFQAARLPLKWRTLRSLQDAYMREADRVITPSAYLKRIVSGWGVDDSRIEVIYNAVPQPPASPRPKPTHDLVGVGRLVAWKGFAELIGLAAERGWSLRIVGDGPLLSQHQQLASSSGAKVRFDGHLPQAEIAGALRDGRVFVLNSSYEGLPHIVLEAMAAGVPVVATAAGGTPETMPNGEGILVPVGDTRRLDREICRLLEQPATRQALADRASAMIADKFTFAGMVDRTERILVEAAGKDRNGSCAWPTP